MHFTLKPPNGDGMEIYMSVYLEEGSYGRKWSSYHTDRYEGYKPLMSDYHMHKYYEISLIFSGNVKVLLKDTAQGGKESRIVLLRPYTPHLITCEEDMLYKRVNLLFSHDFIAEQIPEYRQLLTVFGSNGRVITISKSELAEYSDIIEGFEKEESIFRKRLILMYFLSKLSELGECERLSEPPSFISSALSYIQENFRQKILASELAWKLGIGRTTLMTEFKRHTGITLNGYITDCRLKAAIELMKGGACQAEAAEKCGFTDPCNMIRTFKKRFGMTPKKYILDSLAL